MTDDKSNRGPADRAHIVEAADPAVRLKRPFGFACARTYR